jgi:fluoroquinolone transport system permease protein
MLCDVRLQLRQGFYHAAAFVALFSILVLRQAPADSIRWLMPLFILSNLQINTFYFVGGLVFLEKGEGTLLAQAATPLRNWEYLLSKTATLTLLALIENLFIIGFVFGLHFALLAMIAGVVTAAAMFVLTGFMLASRYDSISEYLFPSFLYTLAFAPPFLGYAGLWESTLLYLHPLQAPLVLTQAAFGQVPVWYWIYGPLYSALWISAFLWLSRRAFAAFVVVSEGVR